MAVLCLLIVLCAGQVMQAQELIGFSASSAKEQLSLENKFLQLPKASNTKQFLFKLTEEPHIAGSPEGKAVAEYINDKYNEWGLNSKLVEYHAYLPYPVDIQLTMLQPDSIRLSLQEPAWRFDKDAYDQNAVTAFNAYSPDGDVTAQIIYANRGLPDDYERLTELGIDVMGKIVLVRYGGSFRGVKAKTAEDNGAAGLIIYSDPADDGFMRGDIYPHGPMRPSEAIQRGSLLYIFNYPGDPLTPGYAAKAKAKRLKHEEATNMARIPTSPISYGQAALILKNLAGPEVPDNSWQGGLPFRYHVGPGPAQLHLKLKMDYRTRPIHNVIAKIEGIEEPDKMIIIGNHHDAWIYGAVDPSSGTAAVMEIGRALGELMKTGWRPKRTIVLAHWDAEEYGLIGSTEWVEEHRENLINNAVLYINIDSAVSGENFGVSSVPSLDGFIRECIRDVHDPKTGDTIFDRVWKRQHEEQFRKHKSIPDSAEIRIGRLGSGSDYTAFLQHSGIPSLSAGFRGRYGVYHSILDNFFWMENWGDPTFEYHAAMSRVGGLMALRFANSDIFPFAYSDYAEAIEKHIGELEESLKKEHLKVELDFSQLKNNVREWRTACLKMDEIIQEALSTNAINVQFNTLLMELERDLTLEQGLPGREWFKHRIYAPGFYTGYAAKPLAGIAEPAEKAEWQAAQKELDLLTGIMQRVIERTRMAEQL